MSGTLTLSKDVLAKRFGGATDPRAKAKPRPPAHDYNIALVCGNMVEIFTPDRFHEIQKEVDRLLSWGNDLADIDLQLLESDDPFQ
jgi:hypothetical protein